MISTYNTDELVRQLNRIRYNLTFEQTSRGNYVAKGTDKIGQPLFIEGDLIEVDTALTDILRSELNGNIK